MERTGRNERWPLSALIDISFASTFTEQSALEYFSKRFRHSMGLKTSHDHELSGDVITGMAELYNRMIPLVLEARTVLEAEASELLDPWQEATGTQRMAYQTVLTGVVLQSPEMRQLHSVRVGDEGTYAADCHNAVLWLGGWLRTENNPSHETRPSSS